MRESKLIDRILCLFKKTLTLHNVIILIKPVFNKYQNHHYCYNVFLENCSFQLPKT